MFGILVAEVVALTAWRGVLGRADWTALVQVYIRRGSMYRLCIWLLFGFGGCLGKCSLDCFACCDEAARSLTPDGRPKHRQNRLDGIWNGHIGYYRQLID